MSRPFRAFWEDTKGAAQLKKGEKTLIGNSAYRRYLRRATASDHETKAAFLKSMPASIADAERERAFRRFDGIFVLRVPCQARITPLQAVLRYRRPPPGRGVSMVVEKRVNLVKSW